MPGLKRTLGLAECIFFGVGSILGAGIYTLIGKVALWSGYMIWLSFLIASLAALMTAFSYAELSSTYPKSGGEFVYAKKAFGRTAGMILGCIISLNGIISGAAVSIGFAGYFSGLFDTGIVLPALGIVTLLLMINLAGIRQSSVVNIIFTILEAAGLVLVLYAALPSVGEQNLLAWPDKGLSGVMIAAALGFYAYIGFEDIVKLAGETRSPERNIPLALFSACIIVITIYTLVAISSVSAVHPDELGNSEKPLAEVVRQTLGSKAVLVISAIALFSTSNTILANMIGSSRVLLELSAGSRILKFFSTVSRQRKTPAPALFLIFVVMCSFVLIGDIEMVARIATIFIFLTFIVVNLAAIVLRFKAPAVTRPFRIRPSAGRVPLFPVLGILLTVLLLVFNLIGILQGADA